MQGLRRGPEAQASLVSLIFFFFCFYAYILWFLRGHCSDPAYLLAHRVRLF